MSTISSSTTTTTAFGVTADTTGALVIQTGATPTTAMTIDTSQNVGIGTASPANKLHVSDTTTSTVKTRTQASTGYVDVGMGGNSGVFDTTATDGIRLRMSGNDKVSIDGSTLALPGLQGIKFQATQSASSDANTLDDYEEGTWTPNQGSGLTVVGAFSSSGVYTKIGRQVTVAFTISGATTIAVSAGGVITSNLPFTALTSFDQAGTVFRFGAAGGQCIAAGGDTRVYNGAVISAGGGLNILITYFV